ncbi:MAG: HEAT repeat domain-containing protein [Methanospirillum sp.]|nr:HEAT repeat domain-containing protein [Methanospirillum sp.]
MEKQQSVSELVESLVQGTTYQMLEAAQSVAVYGDDAVSPVATLLASSERETRWRAAVALERIGAPAVDVLVVAAKHDDYQVRVPAIWALEHIGDDRALDSLLANLNGENECCRWMAAAALSKIGDESARAAVETAFADDPAGRGIVEELIEGS